MENDIIKKAKQRFDMELHTKEYKEIHSDREHLKALLRIFPVKENGTYLDLGTGNGYVAFALAKRFGHAYFTGLDIAEKSINVNSQIVTRKNIKNILFKSFDGNKFPFTSGYFDGMISRYALHHFPDIGKSLSEINRVLKDGGFFMLSDAMTYPWDVDGFIDEFQNLKDDGHVHFYYEDEIISLFQQYLFNKEDIFYSYIRYPRPLDDRYNKLAGKYPKEIINKYKVTFTDNQVYITVKIINILFRKTGDKNGGR